MQGGRQTGGVEEAPVLALLLAYTCTAAGLHTTSPCCSCCLAAAAAEAQALPLFCLATGAANALLTQPRPASQLDLRVPDQLPDGLRQNEHLRHGCRIGGHLLGRHGL